MVYVDAKRGRSSSARRSRRARLSVWPRRNAPPKDNGATWTLSRQENDSPIDDRDAGICTYGRYDFSNDLYGRRFCRFISRRATCAQGKGRPNLGPTGGFTAGNLRVNGFPKSSAKMKLARGCFGRPTAESRGANAILPRSTVLTVPSSSRPVSSSIAAWNFGRKSIAPARLFPKTTVRRGK